ncbi:unnamed protein product [Rotaria sp. Silwood2]|nr:unnamed protein product [Rotaria sp. Silwood2]
MARKLQRLAIISSVLIVPFAYLYHIPNNKGISQMNRIRLLRAAAKITSFVIEDTTIEGVSLRIYSSLNLNDDKTKHLPAVIFYHEEAYYIDSVEIHHPITRRLALQTGFIVISVEYRLAAEHSFPAGLDDCIKVTQYVLDSNNAEKLRIDSKCVAISGDLAAVISMRFTNNSKKSITDNMDDYPKLMENEKQLLHSDISLLLVDNEDLAKLS